MVKRIHFNIDSSGEVSVSVEGATGNECERMTAPFESLLGQVHAREYKDTFYQTAEDVQNLDLQQGEETT